MSTANILLRWIYDDLERDTKLPLWLRDRVRDFLAAEPDTWQSLTDDEVWEISKQNADDYEYFTAIEAKLKEKNHPPKPEPEAEYDLSSVIPLTHRKAKGIIKDRGYNVTGFVLTRKDGDKCIVDMSAVRWLTDKEFFEMMHPPVVSPTAEKEAEPVFIRPDHLALARKSPFLCQVGPVQVADFIPLYTKPEPTRKPMSEEEIEETCDTKEFDQIQGGMREAFYFGVRFAEKHHGIGGDDGEHK